MADELGNAGRQVIGQDGHNDGAIGIDRQELDGPAGRVAGANGDLVSLLNAGSLEKPVVLLYEGGHIQIGIAGAHIVAKGGLVGPLVDLVLEFLQVVLHAFLFRAQRYKKLI